MAHSIDLNIIKFTPNTQWLSHSLLLIYVNSITYCHFILIWIKPYILGVKKLIILYNKYTHSSKFQKLLETDKK